MNADMLRPHRVRTIFVAAPYPDDAAGREFIEGASIHVGDDNDPTKNPTCGDQIYDSGVYECNLVGKFVGISRTCSNFAPLGLVELMAFDTVIMDGVVSAVGVDNKGTEPPDDSCTVNGVDSIIDWLSGGCPLPVDSGWRGKTAGNIQKTRIKSPRYWSKAVDGNYSRIYREPLH
jgi:hypothetical protein